MGSGYGEAMVATGIRENGAMGTVMGVVFKPGQMEKCMQANGKQDTVTGTELW